MVELTEDQRDYLNGILKDPYLLAMTYGHRGRADIVRSELRYILDSGKYFLSDRMFLNSVVTTVEKYLK